MKISIFWPKIILKISKNDQIEVAGPNLFNALYFTNFWCLLDFLIVTTSWAALGIQWANTGATIDQLGALKALRALRAFRPLRAVSRWRGMRVVMDALIFCIPSIGNVILVCLLFWIIFGIAAVNLFGGQFGYCKNSDDVKVSWLEIANRTECKETPGYTWTVPHETCDNVIFSFISLFQVATFEGWMEVIASAQDANGRNNQPKYRVVLQECHEND